MKIAVHLLVAAGVAILAPRPADAATSAAAIASAPIGAAGPMIDTRAPPVFKCGSQGSVLYTDEPCQGGERMDLRAGSADPASIERLARAQAAFDRRLAERQAVDARDAAARRELAAAREYQAMEMGRAAAIDAGQDFYGYPDWGWFMAAPTNAKPHRAHRQETQRASPHVVDVPRPRQFSRRRFDLPSR